MYKMKFSNCLRHKTISAVDDKNLVAGYNLLKSNRKSRSFLTGLKWIGHSQMQYGSYLLRVKMDNHLIPCLL